MQQEKQLALYRAVTQTGSTAQKRYRTVGLTMFCVAAGLLIMRLLLYYLPITDDVLADAVFSIPLQVGILFVLPLLLYRFLLRMPLKEVFAFSNVKRTRWYNCLLAVPLGLCAYGLTLGISGFWQTILMMLGYTHSSSAPLPEVFSPWLLVVQLTLTAVLPAFCEEFCNRGGFLTVLRGSFPLIPTLFLCGVQFGLFHQNITQVFYTMFFGALAAFLTLKCGSSLPAMVVHFVNNGFSVFNEFCYRYGWLGGGLTEALDWTLNVRPLLVPVAYVLTLGVGVGIVLLIVHLNSAVRLQKKRSVIVDAGFDHTNNRVVPVGELDEDKLRELDLDREVLGHKLSEQLYRPTLADNAFYLGAAVIAVVTTLATFFFGAVV